MASTTQAGPSAPGQNWAKMRSSPAYRQRVKAREAISANTKAARPRYTPPLNVPCAFLIQSFDMDERKNDKGEHIGDTLWVQLAVCDSSHPDNKRSWRLYFDMPRYTKKKDGSDVTFDMTIARLKAFLAAVCGPDGADLVDDENAWMDVLSASVGLCIVGTPRKHTETWKSKKANPARGVKVGDTVSRDTLVLEDIKEVPLPQGDDLPTVADTYSNADDTGDEEGTDAAAELEPEDTPAPAPAPRRRVAR